MERITQQSEWPEQRICWQALHLATLNPAFLKPSLLKLPRQVIATIFKYVPEGDIGVIWILKILKHAPPERHKHQVPEPVQVWCCADEQTARPQNLSKALQYDVTGYRQVLDNLSKKDTIELGFKGRLSRAEIPVNRFRAVSRHVRKMWPG